MTGTLLTLPDDPRYQAVIDAWIETGGEAYTFKPSVWLALFEDLLRSAYPTANSDSLTLTARHYFPGYLSAGHDVP